MYARIETFKDRALLPFAESASASQETEILPGSVETWLLLPVAAPDFSLPDMSGKVWNLSAVRGKLVLLNFWSAQSRECKEDLQVWESFYSRWLSAGLQVLTLNVDEGANIESLEKLARSRGFEFPILRATNEIAGVYNIIYRYLFDRHRDLGLPTSFLIDRSGEIVKVYQGSIDPSQLFNRILRIFPAPKWSDWLRALPFPGAADTIDFGRNYLSYGSIFFQRGYFEQSANSFHRAMQDDPSSAEACYGLGSALLNQHKLAEARQSFERAVILRASYPDTLANAWNNLGLIATRENQTQEAIRDFSEALRSSPNHLIALNNLGSAYRLQKNWEQARATFERALKASPDDAESNYGLGMVLAQKDNTVQAYEYLRKALKARPDYPEALNNLGILYLRTGRRDEGVASFEKCINVAPNFDQSYINLARVYSIEGDTQKARTILLELLKQHPEHAAAKAMLAQLTQ